MGDVVMRFTIEKYVNDTWGCPELDLMGYGKLIELVDDIKWSHLHKLHDSVSKQNTSEDKDAM